MKRYQAINGFSLSGNVIYPQQILTPENEEQEKQLDVFVKNGSCKELVSEQPETPAEEITPPSVPEGQDLADIAGIGAKTLEKLTAAGITTRDQLKEKLETPEVKEILAQNHAKVAEQLTPAE